MTLLPIVERELRVAARRRSTFLQRLSVALVGLVLGGWIMLFPGLRSPQMLGMSLFVSLAMVSFLYSGFAGVFSTADAVSREKREGTLGLLFLTDLKGYDIVFGKLAATSLNTFYSMLAIFPVMAIPLMIGGVSGTQFWRVVLVCVNNLFFSLALGIFCSAISRDERRAMVTAVLALLFFAAGLPLLAALVEEYCRTQELTLLLLIPSPGYACFWAFAPTMRAGGAWNQFYASVATIHGLSWLLLAASSRIVPRTWQERDLTPAALRRRRFWQRLAHGSAETRAAVRQRLLALNPFYWLTGRDRFKTVLVWAVLGGGGIIWALGLIYNPEDWLDEPTYVTTAILLHTVMKYWLAYEACRQLASDRVSGALELLLVSPLPVRRIVRGQLMALAKQFGGAILLVLAMDCLFMTSQRNDAVWDLLWVAGITVFLVDLATLTGVGMWQALRCRSVNRAVAATVVRVLVLPWILYGMVCTAIGLMALSSRSGAGLSEQLFIWLWMGIALGVDFLFGVPAWMQLWSKFRVAASERRSRKAVLPAE